MMIGLWAIHALVVLPSEVTEQRKERKEDDHEVENRGGEHSRDNSVVLGAEIEFRGDSAVDWNKCEPDDHGARDGEEGVFCPDIGD